MDPRGEERPFGEKREAHRGRELLGLREVECGFWEGGLWYARNGVRLERRGMSLRPTH